MAKRKYKRLKASEIGEIVEDNSSNKSVLKAVLEELSFRKTNAAKRLENRVKGYMDNIATKVQDNQAPTLISNPPRNISPPITPESKKTSVMPGYEGLSSTSEVASENLIKRTILTSMVGPLALKKRPNSQYRFQPWLFSRIIGRAYTLIRRDRNSMHIEHRDSSFDVPLSSIQQARIEKRFMSISIILKVAGSEPSTLRFRGIDNYETDKLLRCLFECRFAPDIEEAISQLNVLLKVGDYVTHRAVQRWADCHAVALSAAKEFTKLSSTSNHPKDFEQWLGLATSWEKYVQLHNDAYVTRLSQEWQGYFNRLESNALTDRQVEAVLRDDDHTLIVAGAGTGKTAAVVGKIGFLIESGEVTDKDILALAFGRDAAQEMRDRVAERTGHDVEIRTFHALGLDITQKHSGMRQHITETATDPRAFNALIARLLVEIIGDETEKEFALDFVLNHRYPAKYLEDFNGRADYFVYLRKHEPRTLRGEPVKSFEELLIADWLLLNGVAFEYEHPYEVQTASRKRRQYKPDFYLVDYGIYLEHFGIGKDGSTAPGIDKKKYREGIEWKRRLHNEHGTVLLETYSWERQQGILLENLEKKLREADVTIHPMDSNQIRTLIQQREVSEPLVDLLQRFLTIFREGMWTEKELTDRVSRIKGNESKRADSFLQLFFALSRRYKSRLSNRQEVDFSDMISQAVKLLEEGKVNLPFRRIIVDEYQDISRGRHRLLKALLGQTEDTRIMCVGDDWQSIYGFTGSDIRMTTQFESRFGPCTRVDLDRTFRFTQPILEASTRFIQKNNEQLRKKIFAKDTNLLKSVELISAPSRETKSLRIILQRIDADRPRRQRWSVMLLGRYNRLKPNELELVSREFNMLDVEFLTIHKSKGLEADAVVVLELKAGRYGFPSEIENDQLLQLVLPGDGSFPHAEERRVLYVAMTRARYKVILVSDPHSMSEFVEELQKFPEVYSEGETPIGQFFCPACLRGKLELTKPKRIKGYAWECTLRPYCTYRAKYCQDCMAAPAISDGSKLQCQAKCEKG